jgi:hypothetical protein
MKIEKHFHRLCQPGVKITGINRRMDITRCQLILETSATKASIIVPLPVTKNKIKEIAET